MTTHVISPGELEAQLQARVGAARHSSSRARAPSGATRWTRRRRGLAASALVGALTIFAAAITLAVHDLDLFQLDRNAAAAETGHGPGDDWATLSGGGGSAATYTGVLADIGADGGTQFQGGGSKDNNDITDWLWKAGEPLDKDDITNAYAAAYLYGGSEVCPDGSTSGSPDCTEPGNLIVYYGLDRYANNGSAQVGFWFLQSPVGLTDTASQGGFKFSGSHTVGDILVQSNFSQGGTIDRITVYKWVGSGGSDGALDNIYTAADCIASDGTPSPGAVLRLRDREPRPDGSALGFHSEVRHDRHVPDGELLRGWAELQPPCSRRRLLHRLPCRETRSSTPFDSRLKDFALGSFDLCGSKSGTKYVDANGDGDLTGDSRL